MREGRNGEEQGRGDEQKDKRPALWSGHSALVFTFKTAEGISPSFIIPTPPLPIISFLSLFRFLSLHCTPSALLQVCIDGATDTLLFSYFSSAPSTPCSICWFAVIHLYKISCCMNVWKLLGKKNPTGVFINRFIRFAFKIMWQYFLIKHHYYGISAGFHLKCRFFLFQWFPMHAFVSCELCGSYGGSEGGDKQQGSLSGLLPGSLLLHTPLLFMFLRFWPSWWGGDV